MEQYIIATAVSFIVLLLFFGVFLMRGSDAAAGHGHHGCGRPGGQCQCRGPRKAPPPQTLLDAPPAISPIPPETPPPSCPDRKRA